MAGKDEQAPAPAPYVDEVSGLRFPAQIGNYVRFDRHMYENEGLGYSFVYGGAGGETITVYHYDRGIAGIPDGVEGAVIADEFWQSISVLDEYVRRGTYVDFELVGTETVMLPRETGPGEPILHAAFRYSLVLAPGEQPSPRQSSHLLFCGFRGKFLKIRFTCPSDEYDAAFERFAWILAWIVAELETRQ